MTVGDPVRAARLTSFWEDGGSKQRPPRIQTPASGCQLESQPKKTPLNMIKFRKNPDQISKQRNDTENRKIGTSKSNRKKQQGRQLETGKSYRAIRKTDTEQGQQKTKNTCKVNEVCFRFRPQKIEEEKISRWATP